MATETSKKAPKKTSNRKRPNKNFILKMADYRGFMTGSEKTSLATLNVKNAMQKVNNRAMSDDVNDNFNGADNIELQRLMKEFVKNVNAVIGKKG